MPLQYQVQNRYQDSGWSPVDDRLYPDIEPVTAPGPDLPTIENRAPRGIHLRNKPNRGD